MIVRMWHGRVPAAKAGAYRKCRILERTDGDVTHFMMVTFWDGMAAVRGFAGDDVEAAKYYPEDAEFLLEFEPRVVHYEVVGQAGP